MLARGSLRSWATRFAYAWSSVSIRRLSVTSSRNTISPSPSFATRWTNVPSMYPSPNGVSYVISLTHGSPVSHTRMYATSASLPRMDGRASSRV